MLYKRITLILLHFSESAVWVRQWKHIAFNLIRRLTPETYIFKDLFWSSTAAYIPFSLPSSLFPRACLLFTDCGKCVLSSHLLTLSCFQLRAVPSPGHPKSPRPMSDSQGRSASRQIPTESIRAGLWGWGRSEVQESKRKRVISREHGRLYGYILKKQRRGSCFLSCPSVLTPPPASRFGQHA